MNVPGEPVEQGAVKGVRAWSFALSRLLATKLALDSMPFPYGVRVAPDSRLDSARLGLEWAACFPA